MTSLVTMHIRGYHGIDYESFLVCVLVIVKETCLVCVLVLFKDCVFAYKMIHLYVYVMCNL